MHEGILLTRVASKNCSYRENKNATRVRDKSTLEMNEFTENECLPSLELKFKILENLRKPLTLKSKAKTEIAPTRRKLLYIANDHD